ncbi:uncharacterized protein LOC134206951 [Armigeres subalbatus]|uniref:uncharacterized protein LOC134206951 n=1 Tax=Armigeres subalbatus TaxID=124917 RepID=UPI002ED0C8CC
MSVERKLRIDTDHAACSEACPVYQRQLEKRRSKAYFSICPPEAKHDTAPALNRLNTFQIDSIHFDTTISGTLSTHFCLAPQSDADRFLLLDALSLSDLGNQLTRLSGPDLTSSGSVFDSTPGRTLAVSIEGAPDPPNAVEPMLPAFISRPGPAFGVRDEVFRAPVIVYIPPDRTRDIQLIESHCRSVTSVSDSAAPCPHDVMIFGDFNLAGIAWIPTHSGFFQPDYAISSLHAGAIKLLDGYRIATLQQINGTRNENNRSLDLCFVSDRDLAPYIAAAPIPLVKLALHHTPLIVAIESNADHDFVIIPTAVSYNYRKADHRGIADVLSNLDWERVLDPVDVNAAAQTFSHVLSYVIDRHVPKKTARAAPSAPWMTRELKSLKTTKRAAFKRFTRSRTLTLKQHYVQLNHEYKRLSKSCYQRYQRGIQRRLKTHPKSFWNFVNEQCKESGLPSSMVFNGVTASSHQEICNFFSSKFASVFSDEELSADRISLAAENVPLSNRVISNIDLTDATISDAISRIKTSFNSGPDGIPSSLLKKHSDSLLSPLQHIFRLSLSSGTFPSCWKSAQMYPVYKKGSKRDINNYRGITSLSAAKFELVVFDPMVSYCKQIICSDQHGFYAGRSTTTNLLCLTSSYYQ